MQYRPDLTRELYTALGTNDAYRLGNLLQLVRARKGLVAAIPVEHHAKQVVLTNGALCLNTQYLADHTERFEAGCADHLEGRGTVDKLDGWESVGVFCPVE